MENKPNSESPVIPRIVRFTAPNTIDLQEELWHKQPINPHAERVTAYGIVASVVVATILIIITFPSSFGFILALVALLCINLGSALLHNLLQTKHTEKHLKYRHDSIDKLAALLKESGWILSDNEKHSITNIMKSDFRVLNQEGVQYRAPYLLIQDDAISSSFYLFDKKAEKALRQADEAKWLEKVVARYEAEHGEFASTELRDAFIAGVNAVRG